MEGSRQGVISTTIGDAAVEGLLVGIVAGVAMAAFILVVEFLGGVSPVTVLGYFDVSHNGSPLAGLFTHLAVAGVYGVVFGLLWSRLTRLGRGWIIAAGVVYGFVILRIAEWIILPSTATPLSQVPFWVMAIAHGIYGAALGVQFGRGGGKNEEMRG